MAHPCLFLITVYQWCFAGGAFRAGSRARGGWPTRGSSAQQAEKKCGADRDIAATVWRATTFPGKIPGRHTNARDFFRRKSARRTVSGEVANRASASQDPKPGPEAEASTRRASDPPPTEDADRLSATNSEVESAMNHRRRRTVLRDACFSQEALNAFNSGDAHLRAAQDGLARATEQYVKDIRVRKFDSYICQ